MDTRERILKAARELFAEKGYDKTTVDEIVERAGVAKGTFYNYFRSKEELIKIVALQSLPYSAIREELEKEHESFTEFLYSIANAYIVYYRDPVLRSLFFYTLAVKNKIKEVEEIHRTFCTEAISKGAKKISQLANVDEKTAMVVFKAFYGALLSRLIFVEYLCIPDVDYVSEIIRLIERSLKN
ncbi:TetR/AcrR family transcriptional regulator [Thermococcus paralvinellae]|uniref:Transcriptional regulator, TetR family n=1 Tax=Thermococcus paralvinellae TaxID=582419 RepID=W0I456_9EURY|nr:TetR/AcrR family transcriptional regulator [Thermococcus paralvinellae]AHF79492.1 Transcriptional regulator, TetR family [Thermococcus paralvinellae]